MELNNDKRTELPHNRFADIRHASEAKNAELRETVERVRDAAAETRERGADAKTDSIELSDAARLTVEAGDAAREARLEELRAATADGSLFNQDRLARAASRLLAGQ